MKPPTYILGEALGTHRSHTSVEETMKLVIDWLNAMLEDIYGIMGIQRRTPNLNLRAQGTVRWMPSPEGWVIVI